MATEPVTSVPATGDPIDEPAEAPHLGPDAPVEKMPVNWLLARLGKRVLRPGGRELTEKLVEALRIGPGDRVVELAPGIGQTARLLLESAPSSYTGVERDPGATAEARAVVEPLGGTVVEGPAQHVPLDDACATVVVGEAMLTMQNAANKAAIVHEAARLLAPGGRYGIHELCLHPDDLAAEIEAELVSDLSRNTHVSTRPLRSTAWRELLEGAGLEVVEEHRAPMRLLSPGRVVADEGASRAVAGALRAVRDAPARRRVMEIRAAFNRWQEHISAIALVARRPPP